MSTERRQENKFIVYTDIVGHTKMLGRLGIAFKPIRERHDELFRLAVRAHGDNAVVKGSGDGFYAATDSVDDAIEIALGFRRALAHEDWNRLLPEAKRTADNHIRSRVGIHSGSVRMQYEDGIGVDFDGAPRNIAEKVMSKAQGNQVLVSRQVRDQGQLNFRRNGEVEWKRFGEYKLREVADTVEIWGLGESELGVGAAPVQDPEHRVIIFAVIHDYSTIVEQAGPGFEALKDAWDITLQKAVDAHSKDTFVKRLPDGSLAAFRNAIDAVRAARDFRRMWKAEMRTALHRLEPKTALDCGLVTFSYDNNRANDVRDQPVNMAAKVAKTGLTAPWQFILTRPVREDAFANMPERDEFKWVCIGRKAVPGEPEPVELWDFQDVQVKREDRTVLWIDLVHIRDDLKSRRDVYIKCVARLDQMLTDALARRAEEAWTLSTDAARVAAFRDPVEAVQAALDLRAQAVAENWGTLFQARGKGWHPLKIALHTGAVRMTSEDGQRKDLKGSPVDGIKCLTKACEMGSTLVSRELKEAVARHLPESVVRWSKVDVPSVDDVAVEGFELLTRSQGFWEKMSPVQRYAAMGAAAVVLIGGGVAVPMIMGGGNGGGGGGGGIGETRPFTLVYDEFAAEVKKLKSVDAAFGPLSKALDEKVVAITIKEREVSPNTQRAVAGVRDVLIDVSRPVDERQYNLEELAQVHAPALTQVNDGVGLLQWLTKATAETQKPTLGTDEREGVMGRTNELRDEARGAGAASAALVAEADAIAGMLPKEIMALRWVAGNGEKIRAAVAKAKAANIELGSKINAAMEAANAGTNSGPRLPLSVSQELGGLSSDADYDLQPVVRAFVNAIRQRHKALAGQSMAEDQIERTLTDLIKPIRAALKDQAEYDTALFAREQVPDAAAVTLDQFGPLFTEGLKPYRLLPDRRGSVVNTEWPRRLKSEIGLLDARLKAKVPEGVAKAEAEVAKAIEEFPKEADLPWIVRRQQEVTREREAVEKRFATLAKAIEDENKKLGAAATVVVAELGPLPDDVAAQANALAGDGDATIKAIGTTVRSLLDEAWAESRRLRRSPADAKATLEPVLKQLKTLTEKRATLDTGALAADRAVLGEPTAGTLDVWLARLGAYARIGTPDPRDAAEKRLAELRTELVGTSDGKLPETELPRSFRDAQATLLSIAKTDYPWIEKNRDYLTARADLLVKSLAKDGPVEKALREAATLWGQRDAIDRARRELDKVAETSPVTAADEPEAFRAWEAARRKALDARTGSSAEVDAAKASLQQTKASITSLIAGLPSPSFSLNRRWTGAVVDALKARRAGAIEAAVSKPGAEADQKRTEYASLVQSATAFVTQWAAIEDVFAEAGQLATKIPTLENKTVEQVVTPLLKHPLLDGRTADAGVQEALKSLVARANLLKRIAVLDRAQKAAFEQLVGLIDDQDAEIETRVAVWNAMEFEAFADSREWLESHKRVFRRVENDLNRLPEARANAFRTFLAQDKAKRWMMHARRLATFDQFDRAMADRENFAVTDAVLAAAPVSVRWNVRVWKIDRARRTDAEDATRAAVAELEGDKGLRDALAQAAPASAFLSGLGSLGGGGGAAPVAAGSAPPSMMGPGREGWEFVPGESRGDRLVYQMKQPAAGWVIPGKGAPKLTFQAVNAGGETTYLATSEVSVRVVIESLRALGLDGAVYTLIASGQREGPFTWGFASGRMLLGFEGETGANTRGGWVKLGGGLSAGEYFGANAPPALDADVPFQYVSFPTAVFLARQLGCRLPTAAEWAAALATDGGVGDLASRNLRDASYKRFLDQATAARGRSPGCTDPDKDVYWAARADKNRTHPGDDGVVFFAPVEQDRANRTFKHLVGNVAEVTCDKPRELEAVEPRSMPAAEAFAKDKANTQAFAIVGESALGEARDAAAITADLRRPTITPAQRTMLGRGWSDVGVRLAFSPSAFKPAVATGEELPYLARLRQVFDQAPPYLASGNTPPPPGGN